MTLPFLLIDEASVLTGPFLAGPIKMSGPGISGDRLRK